LAQYFAPAKKYGFNKKHRVFLNTTTPCIYYTLATVSYTSARECIVTLGLRSRAILGILPSNNTSLSERSSSTADTHTHKHSHSSSLRVVYYYYIIFLLLLLIHLIGLIVCVCVSVRRTFERPELFLQRKNFMLFT